MSERMFAFCALATIAALLLIGLATDGVARNGIQAAPLWMVVWLGLGESTLTKWAAVPMFLTWLLTMGLTWLFLLGLARIVTGSYSVLEIAMTVVVGGASMIALLGFWGKRARTSWQACLLMLTFATTLQLGAMNLSLQPAVSSDRVLLSLLQARR